MSIGMPSDRRARSPPSSDLRKDIAMVTPTVNPVPPADGATPYIVVRGAPEAIDWYTRALGAELYYRLDAPDGSVMHAELAVNGRRFMLSEERADWQSFCPLTLNGSSTTLLVYVPDVDAAVERAVAAGAKLKMPVADMFWGDRAAPIVDPFGHQWYLLTHLEDLTPEQIRQRMQAMFARS
jgi:PhnB protein